MDVTGSRPLFGEGPEIAAAIKAAIREEVGLTASAGVATTKLVAKIASTYASPTGSSSPAGEEAALGAAADLAPVGRRRQDRDGPRGWRQDHRRPGRVVARPPGSPVQAWASLVTRAVGLDDDPVHEGDPAKSVGHETTFDVDSSDPEVIERTLLALSDGAAGRLRSAGVKASTIAVKIRDSSFRTITGQRTLAEPTDLTEPIFRAALELARPQVRGTRVRPGGHRLHLGEREQLGLFPDDDPRRRKAIEAADGPSPVWLEGCHPRTTGRRRAARALRARSAEPAGPAGGRSADGVGGRRSGCRRGS